ncbi:MAG: hypothetical protein AB7T07_12880 [Steroidobacteraceae bacterium]
MTDKRYKFGVWVSVLWILAMAVLLYVKRSDVVAMTPNTWGDFFAGVFAPLAFLWLVLGYLQQGEELRLSTQALLLQAEELKNSVEQQQALVEVSRQQVESERDALAQERQIRDEEARPVLDIDSDGGAFRGDGHSTYNISISNVGNTASALVVNLLHKDGRLKRLQSLPLFNKGQHIVVRTEVAQPKEIEGAELQIEFRDRLGRTTRLKYAIMRRSEDPHSSLVLQRVEA